MARTLKSDNKLDAIHETIPVTGKLNEEKTQLHVTQTLLLHAPIVQSSSSTKEVRIANKERK